ncbi:MAG: flavin reductase family protein [Clostridia bacterium]|nr:flavin reductase family protein [Clostridia bacterium]
MLDQVVYENFDWIYKQMTKGGLFLTTKGKKLNTMVIGWGGINVYFRIPIFIVPVRESRYTHQIMENSREFTVSIPQMGTLKKELSFCGTKSGRDFDKFKECGLTPIEAKQVSVPVIKECKMHFECEIIYKQHMIGKNLDNEIDNAVYSDSDYHSFYFGKILTCYKTK